MRWKRGDKLQDGKYTIREVLGDGGFGITYRVRFSPPPPPADDLSSDKGVDYRKLRDLLADEKWKEADEETRVVVLKAAGKEREGWLRKEDIDNFPSTDLHTIDRLWVKYSNGRFGFSVQKHIWLEVGGKLDKETECQLADRVGWRKNEEWLNYDDLTFDLKAPVGHFPAKRELIGGIDPATNREIIVGWGLGWFRVGWWCLFSRVET